MKNILESEDIFEAHARIDFCYYMLQEITRGREIKLSPIEMMVDKATCYAKANYEEVKKSAIELLEQVIIDKKIIDADFSNDEKALIALRNIES